MKQMFAPLLLALALAGCQNKPETGPGTGPDIPPQPEHPRATVYTTSVAGQRMTESQMILGKPDDVHSYIVRPDGQTYQTVDGFGLAITQASCYNLLRMSQEERTSFLTELFSREKGLGSSLIRVCIGGSDFSLDEFTWCDEPGMEHFGVHPLDAQYLFPILDEIYQINPAVKIIGSPWSCPRWMKMGLNGSLPYNEWTSGRLNPLHYQEYAEYFVRWIQEMERRGYPIYAVTLQNEPLNKGNSMSLYMPWEDQLAFIKEAVGPAFRAAGIQAKILLFDHNYNYDNISGQNDYPLHIYADAEASQYVAGSAWHNYGGRVSELDQIAAAAPDKEIYFTEASIGEWNYTFDGCLINDFRDIFLGTLARGGKGVTLWNLMLDKEGKPYRPGGCGNCYGAVTISPSDYSLKSIVRNSHYYNVAHCSKVLQPGAVRLGINDLGTSGLSCQWYRNPDGSQAVLLLNESASVVPVNLVSEKYSAACKVPAKAIQSIIWNE